LEDSPQAWLRVQAIGFLDHYLGYWRWFAFVDRSGGLITFAAEDHETAADFARDDPFMRENLLAQCWLKEWIND